MKFEIHRKGDAFGHQGSPTQKSIEMVIEDDPIKYFVIDIHSPDDLLSLARECGPLLINTKETEIINERTGISGSIIAFSDYREKAALQTQ